MDKSNKHLTRVFGGLGTVGMVYVPLRWSEPYSAVLFLAVLSLLSYGLGRLLERES